LSIASETTTPRRSWRRPRSCSGFGSRVIGLRSPVAAARFGRVFCGRFGLCCGFSRGCSLDLGDGLLGDGLLDGGLLGRSRLLHHRGLLGHGRLRLDRGLFGCLVLLFVSHV
jgi:hypothetical protein